jgi:chromosome segregation protein
MHIKELVLDNFKSFGRKTRIPFYEDFTTVSGPNGSGKSNIIDSILFALGLARTSGIRAEKLTDLIYNPGHQDGSSFEGERQASVEVILDNEDRTLDRSQVVNAAGTEDAGDVDEISITRRVKETEENYYSYYYINGRSVNLGDIQDLLEQAGITPEGYNVVMQGDVTEIINMTPGSRREIVDEIAGVAQFDAKKKDAFEELDVVEDHINEAELRIEEKEDRLEQLEDERETALEYQDLRDEKEEYEGYRKAAELTDKREELADIEAEIEKLSQTLNKRQAELDDRQARVMDLESDLEALNAEIERKGEDEQLAIKREIEEIKGDIARLEDGIENEEAKIEDAENERRQAFIKIDRKQEEIEDLGSEIQDTKVAKSSIAADIQQKENELAEVEAKIDEVGEEFEEVKEELDGKKATLEEAKSEKNDLQREQDRLLDEARRRSNEQREAEAEIDEVEVMIPELEADIADMEDELEKADKNYHTISEVVEDLKAEKSELQSDLEAIEDRISAAQQEYAELEAKADQSGDSSYGRAVTTILDANREGVHGTVAQLGSVSGQYATACETAAGGRLAQVVVDDDGVGQRCIEYLKSRNAGRATFLPITEMHDRSLPSLPSHGGVVDFAYDLVDFDSEYSGIFSYVLGDTVVVEDMETARDLMGQYRLVTLDGDLVEKSGAMTGGSKKGSRYSFEGSDGRLERVAQRINDLEDQRQDTRSEIRDVEERLDNARDRQSEASDQVREIQSTIDRKESEVRKAEERVERLHEELKDIEEQRESVSEQMDELEGKVAEQNETIATAEERIAELKAEVQDSELPRLTAEAEEIHEDIDDLERKRDGLDSELSELELEKEYAEGAIDELEAKVESAKAHKTDAKERIEDLEAEIVDKKEALGKKEAAVAELEKELAELKSEREDLREDVDEARQERDAQKETVSRVEDKLATAREEVDRLEWEIDELENQVGEFDPEGIPDHDEVEAEITRLEADMEALEPVNMLAIEEYDDVQADLDDLLGKKDTLAEEAKGIRDRIATYESRKKETFMESYNAIDEQFQDIFERLSNGSGRLHLEDEDDPFEGGLTMKAQPGDKPIQRLEAMSGGEKSLTALAFIFAIQRHNPAPFYALDEVDAFLDAANADLVGEMVDELAGDAQFVVVSHRSAMLERSERAIGVTMQDDNVSAVTGIDLSGGDGEPEVPADD